MDATEIFTIVTVVWAFIVGIMTGRFIEKNTYKPPEKTDT